MSVDGKGLKDEGTQTQVAIAGAVAGLVARFITAPLDVLKIRLQLSTHPLNPISIRRTSPNTQSQKHHQQNGNASLSTEGSRRRRPYALHLLSTIIRTEGPTALWKGNVPAQLLYFSYSAVQFSTYRFCAGNLSHLASSTTSPNESSPSSTQPSNSPTGTKPATTIPPSTFQQAIIPLIAGGTAGAIATAATYPLDLLRTRFAAQGAADMTSCVPGGDGIINKSKKEKVYPTLRAAIRSLLRGEEVPVRNGNTVLSTTIASKDKTLIKSTKKAETPVKTFSSRFRAAYRGLAAAELGTAPYMGLFFCSYEALRPPLRALFSLKPSAASAASAAPASSLPSKPDTGTSNTTAADISASTLAALLSKTAVFPLDTVRKRMQVEGPLRHSFTATNSSAGEGRGSVGANDLIRNGNNNNNGINKSSKTERHGHGYKSTFRTLSEIARTEGWRGLYRGWAVGLGKAAPASVVTVGIYEWVLARLVHVHGV